MKLLIINGPNLNKLGEREQDIYGSTGFDAFLPKLKNQFPDVLFDYFQTNIEGEIINKLYYAEGLFDGVILNPGGYTHTSIAIADAIRALGVPVVEVHISNLFAREQYRHVSLSGAACKGCITGFGLDGYVLAVKALML